MSTAHRTQSRRGRTQRQQASLELQEQSCGKATRARRRDSGAMVAVRQSQEHCCRHDSSAVSGIRIRTKNTRKTRRLRRHRKSESTLPAHPRRQAKGIVRRVSTPPNSAGAIPSMFAQPTAAETHNRVLACWHPTWLADTPGKCRVQLCSYGYSADLMTQQLGRDVRSQELLWVEVRHPPALPCFFCARTSSSQTCCCEDD